MRYLSQILVAILTYFLVSCQTSQFYTKSDPAKKQLELQSSQDSGSTMRELKNSKDLQAALDDSLEKIKVKENDVALMYNVAQIYLARDELDKSEAWLRKLLRFELNNQEARLALANIYFRRSNYDMTAIILNSLTPEFKASSQWLNQKALVSQRQSKPELALAEFREAIKIDPSNVAARMNLGVLYFEFQQFDQAATQFERVLKVMPSHSDAMMHLGAVYSSRGDFSKADQMFAEVSKIDSENPLLIFNLATLEERKGNYDESIKHLRDYLDSDYARAKNNQEVFVMIDRIRTKKEALGASMSDKDIKELASKAKQGPRVVETAKVEEDDKTTATQEPRRFDNTKEEIEALERALQ